MLPFETDYFDVPEGTFREDILEVAKRFASDGYKAPEQIVQASDYIKRYDEAVNG